jgi:hypothetical protein
MNTRKKMIAEMNVPDVEESGFVTCAAELPAQSERVAALRGSHERIDDRIGDCLDQRGKRQSHHQPDRDDNHITAHEEIPEPLDHDVLLVR